jgi:hypothetical protein
MWLEVEKRTYTHQKGDDQHHDKKQDQEQPMLVGNLPGRGCPPVGVGHDPHPMMRRGPTGVTGALAPWALVTTVVL